MRTHSLYNSRAVAIGALLDGILCWNQGLLDVELAVSFGTQEGGCGRSAPKLNSNYALCSSVLVILNMLSDEGTPYLLRLSHVI